MLKLLSPVASLFLLLSWCAGTHQSAGGGGGSGGSGGSGVDGGDGGGGGRLGVYGNVPGLSQSPHYRLEVREEGETAWLSFTPQIFSPKMIIGNPIMLFEEEFTRMI